MCQCTIIKYYQPCLLNGCTIDFVGGLLNMVNSGENAFFIHRYVS